MELVEIPVINKTDTPEFFFHLYYFPPGPDYGQNTHACVIRTTRQGELIDDVPFFQEPSKAIQRRPGLSFSLEPGILCTGHQPWKTSIKLFSNKEAK